MLYFSDAACITGAMDAIVFDFDGVIADSEPVHFRCFAEELRPLGIELGEPEYYSRYIGYEDHEGFEVMLRDRDVDFDEALVERLVAGKTAKLQHHMRETIAPIVGTLEWIAALRRRAMPMAICSGAQREEVELGLERFDLAGAFPVIVAAQDVDRSKPDPQGYAQAVERLGAEIGRALQPGRCLAIEDSAAGIAAARGAGLAVVAITSSHPAGELTAADCVVDSLAELDADDLDAFAAG